MVYEDESLTGVCRPENYGGEFYGPIPLRTALDSLETTPCPVRCWGVPRALTSRVPTPQAADRA